MSAIPEDIREKARQLYWLDGPPQEVMLAIARALLTERERCALIADGFKCGSCGMDGKAGDAIRSQSLNT